MSLLLKKAAAVFGLMGLAGMAFADTTVQVPVTSTAGYIVQPGTTSTTGYVVQPTTASAVPVAVPVQTTPITVIVNNPPPPADKHDEHQGWGEFNISGGKAMFKGTSGDFLDDS